MKLSLRIILLALASICTVDASSRGRTGLLKHSNTRTTSKATRGHGRMGKMQREPSKMVKSILNIDKFSDDSRGPPPNGKRMEVNAPRQTIPDVLGTGWLRINFGDSDVLINRRFVVESNLRMVVRVVDLYCIGDVFKVMTLEADRYRVLGETNPVKSDNCQTITADPDTAWEDGVWSRGEFVLPPGRHTIIMAAISSPYGGGTAAIRIDEEENSTESGSSDWEGNRSDSDTDVGRRAKKYIKSSRSKSRRSSKKSKSKHSKRKQICPGVGGLVVINYPVTATNVESVCRKFDWTAAQLSSDTNVKRAAIATLKKCVKPKSTVWIGGYNRHDPASYYGATLNRNSVVEINTWDRRLTLPVLCKVDDK